jgi:hypothetical protein
MKPTKFMFINKDARSNSLSHSHKNERIKIHSHVQKGRRYKKSDQGMVHSAQLPILQPSRRRDESVDSDETNARLSVVLSQPLVFAQWRPELGDVDCDEADYDPNIDPLLWNESQSSELLSISPQSVPVFPSYAEESFDPFNATCIKVDQAIHTLLQYFLKVLHPNTWHMERATRSDHAYTFRTNAMTIMQGCMHDAYNMYTLIAYASSYMSGIDGLDAPRSDVYYHKAIKASRDYVNSGKPVTGRLIFNTFAL